MATHTARPWTLTHDRGNYVTIKGANGEDILSGCGCCGSPGGDNLDGDGPLIESAPDLLDFVQEFVNVVFVGDDPILQNLYEKAQALIHKSSAPPSTETKEP